MKTERPYSYPNENRRWWELYILRYALGTVIGAICVYLLLDFLEQSGNPHLKALLLMSPPINSSHIDNLISTCNKVNNDSACILQIQLLKDLYGLNFNQILLLGIYGLAFSYIASSPLLVFHATRFLTFKRIQEQKGLTSKTLIYFVLGASVIGAVIYFTGKINNSTENENSKWSWGIWCYFLFIWYLTLRVILSKNVFASVIFEEYKKLHQARESNSIDPNSYKDLREHGNAYSILILNLSFLLLLYFISKEFRYPILILLITVLWVFPAAWVYFLGHKIEQKLIDDK